MFASRISRSIVAFCLICFTCQTPVLQAQTAAKFDLTIDNIMRGSEMVGTAPAQVRWSQDSQKVYFTWKQPGEPREKDADLYVVNRDGSGLRKLSEEEAKKAPPANGELSKDKKWTLFAEAGDIFLYDHSRGERKQLTRTDDNEGNPHFTKDQKHVYFTKTSNLFVMSLEDGTVVQMTQVRPAAGGTTPPGPAFGGGRQGAEAADQAEDADQARGNGGGQRGGGQQGAAQTPPQGQAGGQRTSESQDWVKKEEADLLDVVKQRTKRREEQDAKRKERETMKPFQLQTAQSLQQMQLSPDGKYVIAGVVDNVAGSKSTVVPNYVSDSAYTEDIPGRTKVGDIQSRFRLVTLNTTDGTSAWVDHGQRANATQAQNVQFGYNAATLADDSGEDADQQTQDRSQGAQRPTAPRDRDIRLFLPVWSEDGTKAVINARSADNKDRWIMSLDPATGKTKILVTMHDEAWIGGPGENTVGWMPDNQHIYYQDEEKSGYASLYTVSYDGGEPTALISGKYEVFTPELSEDKTKWYFTSSEVHPGERQFYSMPIGGGDHTRITPLAGSNQTEMSPDESMLAIIYSYTNKPPELYLQENKSSSEPKKVTTSPTAEWLSYKWIDPPVMTFAARDGANVYARLYKSAKYPAKGGPAVIFVHGAGYAQNAHKYWSSYYHEYMFHHFLMEHGYIVMDIDYRASSGYGRDWRTGIYRHMGGKDLDDQVDAAKWLVAQHGVDPKRIGLYGGSYGGFITLMAMFTTPDVFAAGAALRPVTDWAHYNHGYTSNILNTPQKDPEAYKQSSPIYFANGLKGALLICHGVVDTNVHFQDTVRLTQKLIELRKENWSVAFFPVEDHGFVENTSWADEYKRIFKLFEDNLKKK